MARIGPAAVRHQIAVGLATDQVDDMEAKFLRRRVEVGNGDAVAQGKVARMLVERGLGLLQ